MPEVTNIVELDVEMCLSFRILGNDMENIVPFYFFGLIFCMTAGPSFSVLYAKNIFRVFFAARLLTSFCHYFAIQVSLLLISFRHVQIINTKATVKTDIHRLVHTFILELRRGSVVSVMIHDSSTLHNSTRQQFC